MRKVKKLTLSAMLTALGVVLLLLAAVFEVLDISIVAVCSMLLVFAQIELGGSYPYLIYAGTSVLSLLLLPNLLTALLYLLFGGLYPLLKVRLEKHPGMLCLVGKLIYISLALGAFFLAYRLLILPDAALTPAVLGMGALCVLVFLLYDYTLTVLIRFYFARIYPRIRKYLH